MEVQLKSSDLVFCTITAAGNERAVAKRSRRSTGARLIDTALDIAGHIDMDNSMDLRNPGEAPPRRHEQRLAPASTFKLPTLVHTARYMRGFPEQKHMHWTTLILEVQELLRGWMVSGKKRAL